MRVGSEQIDGKRRILIVRFPDRIQRKKGEQAGNSEGIMGTCDYIPRYHLWYASSLLLLQTFVRMDLTRLLYFSKHELWLLVVPEVLPSSATYFLDLLLFNSPFLTLSCPLAILSFYSLQDHHLHFNLAFW